MHEENQPTLGRREFLKNGLGATTVAVASRKLLRAEEAAGFSFADKPAQHNWVIVGRKAVYLSHLPMFNESRFITPHRYQVILEATFSKPGVDPQADYFNDRNKHPDVKIYTLNPDDFVLPEIGAGTLTSFPGRIFRGHFEKEGKALLAADVQVKVNRVIRFHEFDPKEKKPPKLQYLLFGKGEDLFLAHTITRAPDFDQILSVKIANHQLSDDTLGRGVAITINRPNTIAQRIKENQKLKTTLPLTRLSEVSGQEIEIQGQIEFYLEEGELRVPANFKTTVEEKVAGFP